MQIQTPAPDAASKEFARKRDVRRMADDMIDIAAAKGCAEDGDLILRGWTADHLAALAPEANRLALRESVTGAN